MKDNDGGLEKHQNGYNFLMKVNKKGKDQIIIVD
jgi:hypothetical protein